MLTREFFGRAVIRYDIERARDTPKFEIDVALQMMPGLMMTRCSPRTFTPHPSRAPSHYRAQAPTSGRRHLCKGPCSECRVLNVIRYDIERARDTPKFEIDVALQMMPGLMMMSGHAHGSCNRRTREMVALENSDDVGMVVNVRGEHRVTLGQEELVLGDGEAVFMSMAEVCSYNHRAPGNIWRCASRAQGLVPC